MSLSPGTRLGPYEVLTLVGAGGMGEVYRARDSKLRRDVAIKVLPDLFATDPERLARFKREAQVLASLNHPNIAHIHGLEDSSGVHALVMELVEGPTLADRIARGPIPLDEALPIARQIAEALEAAHEQGIIHRDLKPANIKVRPDGTVKVLDFGLAKAFDPANATDEAALSNSPTVRSPAMTGAGVILGTAAYMSPEQARGRVVDKRADIWAFGCVLYELVTGSRAFTGDDVQDTLASVLARGPDWRKLPLDTPAVVERLLRRCLEKDPVKRLRDIGDARLEISDAMGGVSETAPTRPLPPGRAPSLATWRIGAAGLVLAGAVSGVTFMVARRLPAAAAQRSAVQRFSMTFPASAPLKSTFALSPAGNEVAYVGEDTRLYFRALDEPEPRVLAGTEGAWDPFFSPDGEWIGYVAAGKGGGGFLIRPGPLKKVPVRGGAPVVLADAVALGASWGRGDTLLFCRQIDRGVAIFAMPASGGTPKQLTTPDPARAGVRVGWPSRLPDGSTLLYSETDQPTFNRGRIVALLRTGERRTVVEQGYAGQYVASGHLVYVLEGSVFAIRFDLDRVRTTGAPVRVIPAVNADGFTGFPGIAVASTGLLLYDAALEPAASEQALEWVARNAAGTPVVNDRGQYSYPRLSPDGRRLAVGMDDDVLIVDLARGTRNRIAAADRGTNPTPPITAWTVDGRQLAISRRSGSETRIDLVDPDDVEHASVLVRRPFLVQLGSWSKRGTLAFFQFPGGTERDVWILEPGATEPRPFLASRFNERGATFSPDGSWLAYVSDPTGRDEVYLRPYPGPGLQTPVSTEGGVEPTWSRDGREIFYREGNRMMAVSFKAGQKVSLGRPQLVFEQPFAASSLGVADYDVGPDGRFVMIRPIKTAVRDGMLTVVQNWLDELKQRVPAP